MCYYVFIATLPSVKKLFKCFFKPGFLRSVLGAHNEVSSAQLNWMKMFCEEYSVAQKCLTAVNAAALRTTAAWHKGASLQSNADTSC